MSREMCSRGTSAAIMVVILASESVFQNYRHINVPLLEICHKIKELQRPCCPLPLTVLSIGPRKSKKKIVKLVSI